MLCSRHFVSVVICFPKCRLIIPFQDLTAASMKFRFVLWAVLPCKIIVDRRFRGTYCLHHQAWSEITRFKVLTAASMKFRFVFWVVLPCKIIIDRRFRGTCCIYHQIDETKSFFLIAVPRFFAAVFRRRLSNKRSSAVVSSCCWTHLRAVSIAFRPSVCDISLTTSVQTSSLSLHYR
jgi:hypothetical protein